MKVDLERLRRSLARYVHAEYNAVPVAVGELAALLAVVDAARGFVSDTFAEPAAAAEWARQHGRGETGRFAVLVSSLEPFTPPADPMANWDRAWEEVDRWNAERDLAVKAAVDAAKPNPRDRARDQLADAGVAVQRQFRSDQERIAELGERISELERECDLRATESASANGLITEIKDRLSRVPALVDAALYATTGPGWTGTLGQEPETTISTDAYRRLYDAACAVRGAKP